MRYNRMSLLRPGGSGRRRYRPSLEGGCALPLYLYTPHPPTPQPRRGARAFLANPKSVTLQLPSWSSSRFSGLRSR